MALRALGLLFRRTLRGPAGGALALLLVPVALFGSWVAWGATAREVERFTGTCELGGILRQNPPLTTEIASGTARVRATGTCSGHLTDRSGRVHRLDRGQVRYRARAGGELSCAGGTADGAGSLIFGSGRRINFDFSELRGPGIGAITLAGRASGSATGVASVSAQENPVDILNGCGGTGIRQVVIDLRLGAQGLSG